MNRSVDIDALEQHKRKWDALARENDRYYVRSVDHEQSDEEYAESGRNNVKAYIEDDAILCDRVAPFSDKVIVEIGCGSGRITKTLAALFKHVVAVDISPTMLEKAKAFVGADNVSFIESDGVSVPVPPETADLAFSYIVYQHFPSREAIEASFQGVSQALRPGGLFKTQVRGLAHTDPRHWSWGPDYNSAQAAELASDAGFRILSSAGEGLRSYWLLLEKG